MMCRSYISTSYQLLGFSRSRISTMSAASGTTPIRPEIIQIPTFFPTASPTPHDQWNLKEKSPASRSYGSEDWRAKESYAIPPHFPLGRAPTRTVGGAAGSEQRPKCQDRNMNAN